MFLIVTRSFPPDLGGMQVLMGGLSEALVEHGPVKVFAYDFPNASFMIIGTCIWEIICKNFI